jgi:transcriptional regulator GlxA family with amidase domain
MAEKKFLTIVDQVVTRSRAPGTPKGLAAIIAAMRVDLSRRWSAAELSALTRLSHSQTRRLFASICGRVLADGCNQRLIYAQSLIVQNNATLSEIAEACGFCDVYHFSREFKHAIGISPAAWRRGELGAGHS